MTLKEDGIKWRRLGIKASPEEIRRCYIKGLLG